MKLILVISCFLMMSSGKKYEKRYHDNGNIKAQGWVINQQKTGYWYFYSPHKQKVAEGHFKNNKKENWWIFYNDKNEVIHKCQLRGGVKNGYCLKYTNNKIKSAEKYTNGKKVNEWFSFGSFKKDNNLSDLK